MSCTFWNMRRRKAQQEKQAIAENVKPIEADKKAVVEDDKPATRKPRTRTSE